MNVTQIEQKKPARRKKTGKTRQKNGASAPARQEKVIYERGDQITRKCHANTAEEACRFVVPKMSVDQAEYI
jgi:hypothetical protein